jgi:hypothetical protein
MTRNKRYNKQDQPSTKQTETASRRLVLEHNFNSLDKIADAIHNKKDADKEEKNQSHIISERQANEQARANRISLIVARVYQRANRLVFTGNLINVFMLAATISVFALNIKGIRAAEGTLQEVKKEFELANRPYVFYNKIDIPELIPNADLGGSVQVKNYGKTPALMLYEAFTPNFSNLQSLPSFDYKIEDYKPLNIYIFGDSLNVSIPFKFHITETQYRDILINKQFLFIHGKIIYRSVIDDKLYEYDYCYSILTNKRFRLTPNHNLVKEIKSDSIPEELKKSGYFTN